MRRQMDSIMMHIRQVYCDIKIWMKLVHKCV